MRSLLRLGLALVILALLPASGALADPAPAGAVKVLYGSVVLSRGGAPQALALGSPVFEGDRIETLQDGHIGITLRDGTRISLGPASAIDLSRIVYVPQENHYGLVLRLLTGTLDYLSGMTAKLAPDSISIETPTSTIAVRGTHLLVRAGA